MVRATGTDITYQWQQSADNGETWTDIAGATSFIYSIGEATADMDGMQYRCVVTGTGGTLNSNVAHLTIHEKTVITAQSGDVTVTEGQPASFQVEATGENVIYQWQQSTDDGWSWTDIADMTEVKQQAQRNILCACCVA